MSWGSKRDLLLTGSQVVACVCHSSHSDRLGSCCKNAPMNMRKVDPSSQRYTRCNLCLLLQLMGIGTECRKVEQVSEEATSLQHALDKHLQREGR